MRVAFAVVLLSGCTLYVGGGEGPEAGVDASADEWTVSMTWSEPVTCAEPGAPGVYLWTVDDPRGDPDVAELDGEECDPAAPLELAVGWRLKCTAGRVTYALEARADGSAVLDRYALDDGCVDRYRGSWR